MEARQVLNIRPSTEKWGIIVLLPICFALLFVPGPETRGDRFLVYLQDVAHFPLFAVMAFLLLALFRRSRVGVIQRAVLIVLLTVLAGVVAEFIQPFVGRTAGVRDVLLGVSGSVAAMCLGLAVQIKTRTARIVLVSAALLLAIGSAWPLVLITCDRMDARRGFPQLASFESRTELGRWAVNGCKVSRVAEHTSDGRWALKIEVDEPIEYPGLFDSDVIRNILPMKRLCVDLFVPGESPLKIWLRLDDRPSPVYSDRFQELVSLFPGTNTICIERAAAVSTPSGRALDLGHIVSWGLFFDQARPGEILYLDNVRIVTE